MENILRSPVLIGSVKLSDSSGELFINDAPISISSWDEQLAKKQDKLVSGVNIKTINQEDILGPGDIDLNSLYIQKLAGEGIVYQDSSGVSEIKSLSADIVSDNVVQRDGTQIKVPETPQENYHAASKKYVTDSISAIIFETPMVYDYTE